MYRNVLLTIHIASVAAWLGANLSQALLTPWFARRPDAEAAAWFEAAGMLARRYYNVAGAVLTVSGVLLVLHAGYDWSAGFIAVGITVIVIGAIQGVVVFAPDADRVAAARRTGEPASIRRYGIALAIDTTLVLTAVLAMVARWRA